jgi:penicillin-binding protein 2
MSSGNVSRYEVAAWRVFIMYGLIVAVIGAIGFRIFNLQVLQGEAWMDQAVDNYTLEISEPGSRGIIYDRNGYILARNIASYNVVITPARLPDDPADIQGIYRELSTLLDMPVNEGDVEFAKLFATCVPGPGIAQIVELGESNAPFSPARIKCNVGEGLARVIRERSVDWPGVSVEIEPIRDYPTGSVTANVVGFLGPIPASLEADFRERGFLANRDKIGYSGVETSLDDILLGRNGLRVVRVDVAGQELRNLEPPIPSVCG